MTQFVKVGIPRSPLGPLTYSVPVDMPGLEEGMRVFVPLGSRFVSGFVVEKDADADENLGIKSVADVLDPGNLFSPVLLKLTRWMADYYMADWADLMKSALPPALDVRPQTIVRITAKGMATRPGSHPLLQVLAEKRNLPLKELYRLFGYRGTFSQIRMLEENDLVQLQPRGKRTRSMYNMVEAVETATLPEKPKERALYEYLLQQGTAIPLEDVKENFKTATTLIRAMVSRGAVRTYRLPVSPVHVWPEIAEVAAMNEVQKKACDRIVKSLGRFQVFLLHGVTGSGKTEVFLRAAQKALSLQKTVLILVPEIALLPLVVKRTQKILRHPVSVLHSELSDSERLEQWQKARRNETRIVIGTRSALFAPLQNIGLIVMDEEHDGSYKQGEYPRYHARESGIMRASYENCPIVLSSATPSIESYFNAGNGKFTYLSLPQRVENKRMPKIHLVDMKEEYRATGDAVFSVILLEELRGRLEKQEQILVLQNRRGYASWLMCRDCGFVLECPHCSVTLTYHKAARRMRCHYCNYSRLAPGRCEKCNSPFLHLYGVGTEKITESLKKMFPAARIQRFDRDATRHRGSIVKILTKFAMKEIDVLVGTQMLAKGHDFPNITLVGVVGADSSIGIPDFRASEKLFQLLTQVAGRSGRGEEPGLVILQTFHPDHYAIRCAIEQSYERFYEREIGFRRLMQYPPFVSLANLVFAGKDAKAVLEEAREFGKLVLAFKTQEMRMLGPAIAPIARLSGLNRFQILVKSNSRKNLHGCLKNALARFRAEGARHSQLTLDIDPYSIA